MPALKARNRVDRSVPSLKEKQKGDHRDIFILLLIVALPLIIRIALTYAHFHHPLFSSLRIDEEEYDRWARIVMQGMFFHPYVPIHSPGYPWLLGAAYAIFGYSLLVPRLINVVLGLGSIIIVQRIGSKLFGKAASYVSALLFGLYWPLIIFEQRVLDVTFFVFLNLLSLFLVIRASKDPSEKKLRAALMWAVTGFCFGAAVLVRPPALAWFLGVLIWLLVRSRVQRSRGVLIHAVAFVVAACLLIVPFIVKNHSLSGKWLMMQTNTKLNLYYGNNPQADGTCYARLGQGWDKLESMPVHEQGITDPFEQESFYFGKITDFIKHDPVSFVWLQIKKLGLLLNGSEIRATIDPEFQRHLSRITSFPFPGFMLVLGLAVPGFLMLKRSSIGHHLLLVYLATHAIATIGILISSRYRMPFTGGLILLSGAGIVILFQTLIRSFFPSSINKFSSMMPEISTRIPRFVPWFLLLLGLAIAALPIPPKHTDAEELTYLGYAWRLAGDDEKALNYYREALRQEPEYANALVQIARIERKRGQFDAAFETLERAKASEPESSIVHYDLAITLWQAGRKDEAIREMTVATECRPMWIASWKSLAAFEYEMGDVERARAHLRYILSLDPKEKQAHEMLQRINSTR